MNIYQKLIEVRKSCKYLEKENQGHQFKFVSSSQTLGSLKEKMDELNLLLIPRVINKEVSDHTTKKGAHEYFTQLDMVFTWVNADKPEESVECPWVGQGLDSGEKGVGKAMTYAEKYFMLKFFNIPTDKDDPDSFQKKTEKSKPAKVVEPKQLSESQFNIRKKHINELTSEGDIKKWWIDTINTSYTEEDIAGLKAVCTTRINEINNKAA
jgi:hypothetical protein